MSFSLGDYVKLVHAYATANNYDFETSEDYSSIDVLGSTGTYALRLISFASEVMISMCPCFRSA
jgi:hypothetical protein